MMKLCRSEAIGNWPVYRLEDVSEIVSGITLGRSVGESITRSVPYLRVANVKDGRLDLSDVKTVEATEAEIAKLTLRRGDLLLTEGGDPDSWDVVLSGRNNCHCASTRTTFSAFDFPRIRSGQNSPRFCSPHRMARPTSRRTPSRRPVLPPSTKPSWEDFPCCSRRWPNSTG